MIETEIGLRDFTQPDSVNTATEVPYVAQSELVNTPIKVADVVPKVSTTNQILSVFMVLLNVTF